MYFYDEYSNRRWCSLLIQAGVSFVKSPQSSQKTYHRAVVIDDTRKPSRFIPIFQIKPIIIWAKLRGRVWRLDLICFCCKIMLWEKGSAFDAHRLVVPMPSVQLVSKLLQARTRKTQSIDQPPPSHQPDKPAPDDGLDGIMECRSPFNNWPRVKILARFAPPPANPGFKGWEINQSQSKVTDLFQQLATFNIWWMSSFVYIYSPFRLLIKHGASEINFHHTREW